MRKIILCLALVLYPFAVNASEPIVIQEQGSFTAGGSTLKNSGEFVFSDLWSQSGQTAYGDNAFVRYQIPVNAKKLPLVFLHGGGQSMKTWETTPDGREGFANIEGIQRLSCGSAEKGRCRLHAFFRGRNDTDVLRPHNVHAFQAWALAGILR